jgi:HAE1 family hydrophobic/amphiphilic exporter-1
MLAMVPLSLGIGAGAEMQQAMAIVVIGGLLLATFLTLVIVPVIYDIMEDLSEWTTSIVRGLVHGEDSKQPSNNENV